MQITSTPMKLRYEWQVAGSVVGVGLQLMFMVMLMECQLEM